MYNTFLMWKVHINTELTYDEFIKLFRNVRKISNNSKLRSFQYRMLCMAIITNIKLKKWRIVQEDCCTLCESSTETIEHLFFECSYAQKLLKQVLEIVQSYKNEICNYNPLTIENVLFNTVHDKAGHLVNFVTLQLKSYLYTSRCIKKKPSVNEFRSIVENARRCELYNARRVGKCSVHFKKWQNHAETDINSDHTTENNVLESVIYDKM